MGALCSLPTPPTAVSDSADGTWVVGTYGLLGSGELLYLPPSGSPLRLPAHAQAVQVLESEGARLWSGASDGSLLEWSIGAEGLILTGQQKLPGGSIQSLAVGPEGLLVVGSADGSVRLLDRTGRLLSTRPLHREGVPALALYAEGLASLGGKGELLRSPLEWKGLDFWAEQACIWLGEGGCGPGR